MVVSNFQKILYNKLTNEQLTQFVICHIKTNCHCAIFSNRYHTFKRNSDRDRLIDFMLYLYTEPRRVDIQSVLKKYFTKDSYGDIKFFYQRSKKLYIEAGCSKKIHM